MKRISKKHILYIDNLKVITQTKQEIIQSNETIIEEYNKIRLEIHNKLTIITLSKRST